jgi:hypothetical protein
MRKQILPTLLSLAMGLNATAQTNPAAFDLGAGDFSFTEWSADAAAGTSPANMAFHTITDPTGGSFDLTANGTGDWNCGYNLTGRNRFIGHGADGVAMRATGSPQWDDCTGGDAAETRYVGAVVAALNTVGRQNITVEWTGGTVTVGDGTPQPRIMALRMQYRIGTVAFWSDLPTVVEYVSQTEGATQDFNVTLPSTCDNQPMVQVRWVYYQHTSGNGTRPELRLDDVEVSSIPLITGVATVNGTNALRAFPNPSEGGVFKLSQAVTGAVFNVLGGAVIDVRQTHEIDLSEHPQGIYLLRTDQGALVRLMR